MEVESRQNNPGSNREFIIVVIGIAIIFVGFVVSTINPPMTGAATVNGVTLSNPAKTSSGLTVRFKLTITQEAAAQLSSKDFTLNAADTIANAVNQANGVATDGLIALLGIPNIPDAIGILASIAGWLNKNASPCLREIGRQYAGKGFEGEYFYSVSKGPSSKLYPGWDYYHASETFFKAGDAKNPKGFKCTTQMGCVFSVERATKKISKSCFG